MPHPHFTRKLGSMSIINYMSIEMVLQSLIQVLEFLGSSKKEDFVSFSMNKDNEFLTANEKRIG